MDGGRLNHSYWMDHYCLSTIIYSCSIPPSIIHSIINCIIQQTIELTEIRSNGHCDCTIISVIFRISASSNALIIHSFQLITNSMLLYNRQGGFHQSINNFLMDGTHPPWFGDLNKSLFVETNVYKWFRSLIKSILEFTRCKSLKVTKDGHALVLTMYMHCSVSSVPSERTATSVHNTKEKQRIVVMYWIFWAVFHIHSLSAILFTWVGIFCCHLNEKTRFDIFRQTILQTNTR